MDVMDREYVIQKMRGQREEMVLTKEKSSFRLRFIFTVVLFLVFWVMDTREMTFFSISSEFIYESICEAGNLFDFQPLFPYTLD